MPEITEKDSPTETPHFLKRPWVSNLLTVLIILAIYFGLRPFMQGHVAQGTPPPIEAQTLTGKSITLEQFKGKPFIIHFWATWCGICAYERSSIESVAKDYPILNIATQSESDHPLNTYVQSHNMNPANVINDFNGKLFEAYGAKAVPATFFINPAGKIEFVEVGYTTEIGMRLRMWFMQHWP